MISAVENFLNFYNIKNTKIIVGFSGGADSCCLALLLNELKYKYCLNITIAYFNHGWRKKEAENEEKFALAFAKKLKLGCIIKKAPSNLKKNEESARNARYSFFEECAKKENTKYVFLAHNKNDNIETLVYRIIKGTSTIGLTSIPKQRDIYYRPLLEIERKDILEFLKSKKQDFMFDSSNNDDKYKRNLIRNKIFPYFEQINQNYIENIENLIKNSISTRTLVNEYLKSIKEKVIKNNFIIRDVFLALNQDARLEILNEILYSKLKYRNRVNLIKIDDFILNNNNSKLSLNKDEFVTVKDNKIFIKKNIEKKPKNVLKINGEGIFNFENIKIEIKKQKNKPKKFPSDSMNVCYLELDFPLELRHRQAGDRFSPYGLSGSMKLKNYLINEKIEQDKKDELVLLCKDGEVCWILNKKISEKYKVNNGICYKLTVSNLQKEY